MRFRLRTLLIFVALAQLPLICYVYLRSRVKRETEAVKTILGDLPGKADRGTRVFINKNTSRWVAASSPTQRRAAAIGIEPWLYGISALEADRRTFDADATSRFANLRSMQCLRLRYSRFDDSAALRDASFPQLTFLDLRGSVLSDPMMAAIGRSHALDMLLLNDCTLPAESLGYLGDLDELTILRLCRVNINQRDWTFLCSLSNLECLMARDVTGSEIPVYKLPPSLQRCDLAGSLLDFARVPGSLPNLKVIDVARTKVGLNDLLRLIPNCPNLESVGIMKGDLDPQELRSLKVAFPNLLVFEQRHTSVIPVEAE